MPKVNTSRPLEGDQPEWMECQGLNNDLVVIEDDFIVASAQSPLISLGRLLHRGWSLSPGDGATGARVNLISPDGDAAVPLQFKRNSLAIFASIRVVSAHQLQHQQQLPQLCLLYLPQKIDVGRLEMNQR